MNIPLLNRLRAPGPKRILSLDGGGIRGSSSLGFLEQIEQTVRHRVHPHAGLADYFDLIGGTSTGAIIAAQLAMGKTVAQVKDSYFQLGPDVFSKRTWAAKLPWVGPKLFTNWAFEPLEKYAKALFSEKTTLGSPVLQTGLCIITKRADTFSTWPYVNHPDGKFYPENADIPLWKLVRASSAAPTYFKPMKLDVGSAGEPDLGVFVDGGVSLANNPALQLFMVATLQGFPFRWRTGWDQLLIVSVGTGRFRLRLTDAELMKSNNIFWARQVPELLMSDASKHAESVLQYLSDSPTARQIDWESGDMNGDLIGGTPQLSYVRYNAILEKEPLAAAKIQVSERELASLRDMAAGGNVELLYKIGVAHAAQQYRATHLPPAFDPPRPTAAMR